MTKVLIGNILSLSKAFGYIVEEEIVVGLDIKEVQINFKNRKMKAFKGKFCVNFEIPNLLGLGKSPSKGYGTIKRI